ncbi:MAG: hypothetical protein ACFN02_01500 [Olsenella profusa]
MRWLKASLPLAVAVMIHCWALGTDEFGGHSLIHDQLTFVSWNGSVLALPFCEFMQRLICAYLFFVVLVVLKELPLPRRLLAAAATTWLFIMVGTMFSGLLSLPGTPAVVWFIALFIELGFLLVLVLTYRREIASAS